MLLACDLNPDYLDFWPSTRRAWKEIVGLDAVLVLVAPRDQIPAELRDDPAVVAFEPIAGLHTAFQAQCIRLLYPALLEPDGAVIISDMDLYPLRGSYFHHPVERLDERFFVSYRDDRLNRREIPIAFNAALPSTWGEPSASRPTKTSASSSRSGRTASSTTAGAAGPAGTRTSRSSTRSCSVAASVRPPLGNGRPVLSLSATRPEESSTRWTRAVADRGDVGRVLRLQLLRSLPEHERSTTES